MDKKLVETAYSWAVIPDDLPRENLVLVTAKTVAKTIHTEDPEYTIRVFNPEDLKEAARSLAIRPVGINHERIIKDAFVVDAQWNEEEQAVEALLYLPDEYIEKIKKGDIKKVSVEYTWRNEKRRGKEVEFEGIVFNRVDLLEGKRPGDEYTAIKLVESKMGRILTESIELIKGKKEYIDKELEMEIEKEAMEFAKRLGEPMGPYKSFSHCVATIRRTRPDVTDPEAYCGKIYWQVEKPKEEEKEKPEEEEPKEEPKEEEPKEEVNMVQTADVDKPLEQPEEKQEPISQPIPPTEKPDEEKQPEEKEEEKHCEKCEEKPCEEVMDKPNSGNIDIPHEQDMSKQEPDSTGSDIIKIEEEKFEPPEAGTLPEEGKEILRKAYANCRTQYPEYSKERCSKIAWGAVKNAGWKKVDDKWVKEEPKEETLVESKEKKEPKEEPKDEKDIKIKELQEAIVKLQENVKKLEEDKKTALENEKNRIKDKVIKEIEAVLPPKHVLSSFRVPDYRMALAIRKVLYRLKEEL